MKRIAGILAIAFAMVQPAQAQTTIFLENFNGGVEDWADDGYVVATHNGAGGHDGGAHVSTTVTIDTSSNGAQGRGGYTVLRCGVAPSGNPALNCSSGNFVGNWYFTDGVQTLRMWFRHNSNKPGGIIPSIRIATPGNTPGGSAFFPTADNRQAVAKDTWTLLTIPIDGASGVWEGSWGAITPDAVQVLRNVGRVQLGYFVEPSDPDYDEMNVTFQIDDVEILGSTSLTAVIRHKGVLHPHHDGVSQADGGNAVSELLDDNVRARVLGASTGAGDPVDINTSNIVANTVRIGPLGGASHTSLYNRNEDSDGIDDAEFRADMSDAVGNTRVTNAFLMVTDHPARCLPSPFGWSSPYLPLRAELTTGEVIAGEDTTVSNFSCTAVCH